MNDQKGPVRIQFDLTREEWTMCEKYAGPYAYRHFFGRNAFLEKVKRMEGRDDAAIVERLTSDGKYLQKLIDGGYVKIPG
jgi:hypothetical protein